jgi:hypothetical protein
LAVLLRSKHRAIAASCAQSASHMHNTIDE